MTEVSNYIMLLFTSIKLEVVVTKTGLKDGRIQELHPVRWQVTKLQGATFQPLWNLDMKIINWKVCWTVSYHIKVGAITKCPDRFKSVRRLWLMRSELWMLFWHRQAAAVLGGPPAGPPERGRAQHDSHIHLIYLEAHNSSLWSLPLTSRQETSTHDFVHLAPSWSAALTSSEAYGSLAWCAEHLGSTWKSSDVMWHWLSFKRAWWEIWVNRVKTRVGSHEKRSQSWISLCGTLNKHR